MTKNNNQNPFIYIKMFSCSHGLTKETCPYCMQQSRIKPPTRLVKLAPSELPLEIPLINDLQKPKSPIKALYKENSPINIKPLQLRKNFSLNMDSNANNPTLFDKRTAELEKLRGYSVSSEDIIPNVPLFDLKKKFTKK